MPLNRSSADSQDLGHAVDGRPAPASCVRVIKQAEVCWQHVQTNSSLPKLRDKLFGFRHAVEFRLFHDHRLRFSSGGARATLPHAVGLDQDSPTAIFYAFFNARTLADLITGWVYPQHLVVY